MHFFSIIGEALTYNLDIEILIFIAMGLGYTYGQIDTLYATCDDDLTDYYSFYEKLKSVDMVAGGDDLYSDWNREYTDTRDIINDAGCDVSIRDSINIELTRRFAKNVVKEKGDLPTYITLLREISNKCDVILESRVFDDGSEGEDFYRGNRDAYQKE